MPFYTSFNGSTNIILEWFLWQFLEVPKLILKAWKNFLKFGSNYFSIPLLIKTLFSPWKRYRWFHPRGFDFWLYLETIFSNLIFRVLGAIVRSVLIIIGVFFEILIFFVGLFILLGWLILPFLLVAGTYHAFRLLS